ncbi:MAG: hypothetical protein F4136_10710, partial [Chloroflexi bacterium]|nr:hypothetical protein [Chloroflexota bacterium]
MEKQKNFRPAGRGKLFWLGWMVAGMALLYLLSPWLSRAFLAVSRQANESAYFAVLRDVLQEEEAFRLPTYTPLPSLTPLPTYTALPTLTPRPTYTP